MMQVIASVFFGHEEEREELGANSIAVQTSKPKSEKRFDLCVRSTYIQCSISNSQVADV